MLRSLVSKPSTSAIQSAVTQYIEPEEQSDPLVPTPHSVVAENKFTVMMNGFSSVSINPFNYMAPNCTRADNNANNNQINWFYSVESSANDERIDFNVRQEPSCGCCGSAVG